MALSIDDVRTRVDRMRSSAAMRDAAMRRIRLVRRGDLQYLFPQQFSEEWPRMITANWVDSVARDFAEMVAPLPSLNCMNSGASERHRERAAKKNKIGFHYWRAAKLRKRMLVAADWLFSYGFLPGYVEPYYEDSFPMIQVADPYLCYYENDRWGCTLRFAQELQHSVAELAAMFPEHAGVIWTKTTTFGRTESASGNEELRLVRYVDKDEWVLYCPDRDYLVLARYDNPLDRCPVHVAELPDLCGDPTGKFDQVIWVQMARNKMALLTLEAGEKAVHAPLAVDRSVAEIAVGPDAIIQSDAPQNIRRIGLEVPQSAFALEQVLTQEMREGSRFPEARSGSLDASVITGRGVQALQGSFDTQISTAQTVLGEMLAEVTSMAFEMDVKVWPDLERHITGVAGGDPYDLKYTPAKDIGADNYACDVTYGYAAGLSPNAAVVMMLQLRADDEIDRGTFRKNLPWDIDTEEMQRNIDVEKTTEALSQGFYGLLGQAPALALQGANPLDFFQKAADVIKARQSGVPMQDALVKAFTPPEPPPEEQQPGEPGVPGEAPPEGQPAGVVPGQMAPGGAPDLQTLLAGLRGGRPVLDAAVSRRQPAA